MKHRILNISEPTNSVEKEKVKDSKEYGKLCIKTASSLVLGIISGTGTTSILDKFETNLFTVTAVAFCILITGVSLGFSREFFDKAMELKRKGYIELDEKKINSDSEMDLSEDMKK